MATVLEFKDLSRPIHSGKLLIRESGSINARQILAVKGPSGSGKSTLLRMLARIVSVQSGDVYWQGRHWQSIAPGTWRRNIHYVSQKPIMFEGTGEDNIRLPFTLAELKENTGYSSELCQEYMKELELPSGLLQQNAQTLSGGEAARLALIRALLIEPKVLLLDEPTAYLDGSTRSKLINLISSWVKDKPERAIIIVSHNDEDLNRLNDVFVLHMNNIMDGVQKNG